MNFLDLIWLIPLFPVAGFVINGLFGKRMPKAAVGAIASGAVLISFLFAVGAVYQLAQLPEHERSGEWGDAVKMITFEGATGVVGTSAVRFSVPLERPVQVPKAPAPTPPPAGGK